MRHLNRNATGQMARNTIVVAVNLIIPPALRPPSARVVVVVVQTRDILGIIRMIGQDLRDIGVRTPPRARQGHRVMHRDGVDNHTLDSLDSTRIPHCPLFSDIMQGACQAQCHALRVLIFFYFPLFKVRCIFAATVQEHKAVVLSRMIRVCVYVIISWLRSAR